MDEVLRDAPNLPDSFVGISPDTCEIFEDHRAERVAPVSVRNAALAGLKHRVGEFADNVELHLLIGVVADADRR
jgi:hypothetical protein